jgi:hypothetical protein
MDHAMNGVGSPQVERGSRRSNLIWPLRFLLLLMSLSGAAARGGDAVFERADDDGSIELTNIPEDHGDYRFAAGPPAPAAPGAVTSSNAGALPAPGAGAPSASASASGPTAGSGREPMRERLRALYDGARWAREAAAHDQ